MVNKEEFFWYAFAVPNYAGFEKEHYFICDYQQLRKWVLDFKAPLGKDYRDHRYWLAYIKFYSISKDEVLGYFCWKDEPIDQPIDDSRIIHLDNIDDIQVLSDILINTQAIDLNIESKTPSKIKIEVNRIIRDTKITKELKSLYKNRCQICGLVLGSKNSEYSEAHHIKPLGDPHNGSDNKENIIILCPNHHAEFDYGYIALDPNSLKVIHVDPNNQFNGYKLRLYAHHTLDFSNLSYHFENIFISSKKTNN